MVFIAGYAGMNTHRAFEVSEFCGFVLSDPVAPLIFVNGRDAQQAQMFTIVHELAHIWLNSDGLFNLENLLPSSDQIETFCDRVAAEFLVPTDLFESVWNELPNTPGKIHKLALRFRVSDMVVARKALDTGKLSKSEFFEIYEEIQARHELYRQRMSEKDGGSFWNTQGARLGNLFGRTVVNA